MDANGRIIVAQPEPTEPPAQSINGSPIQATGEKVAQMTNEQAQAIQTLGGKLSGGKKRYRGGAEVEIQNVPNLVSAGNVDAKGSYAELLKLQAQANTDASYDGLGNAVPMKMGGKRKSRKNKNGRKKHTGIRANRRTLRRTRRVRNSRRKLRVF